MVKVVKIFVLSILFWQCEKKTTSFPEVVINKPVGGAILSFGEDLHYEATLRHDDLVRYRVVVVDERNLANFLPQEDDITGSTYSLSGTITLNNPNMQAGGYLLRITAFTSDDNASKEMPFTYVKTPMLTDGFFTVTDLGNTYKGVLQRYGHPSISMGPWIGKHVSLAMVSQAQQAVLAPQEFGPTRVVDTRTGGMVEAISNPLQGQFPFFMSVSSTDKRYTLGNYLGFVQTRDAGGQLMHNFSLPNDYYASFTAEGHDLMLVNVVHPGNQFNMWRVYNPRTGANMGELMTSMRIAAAFPADANRWWVFYNDNGIGRMACWTPEGVLDVRVQSFFSEVVTVQRMSAHRFLVLSDQGFTEVDTRQSGSIPRSEYGSGQWFDFNALSNRILVADGTQLKEYDLQSTSLTQQYARNDSVHFVGYTYKYSL